MINSIYEKIMIYLSPLVLITTIIPFSTINAQDENLFEEIKYNTVKLTASFPNGAKDYGFGFVVGEDDKGLYIVTARHVVDKVDEYENDNIKADTLKVEFFKDTTFYYIKNFVTSADLDLALLRVPKPDSFNLKDSYLSAEISKNDAVWFIGREGIWFVPGKEGIVDEELESDGKIKFEISTIAPGTSGAPLLTERGIAGLIITDNVSIAEAIGIKTIREFVEKNNFPWLESKMSKRAFDALMIIDYRKYIYTFKRKNFSRYTMGSHNIDAKYPQPLPGDWGNMPKSWYSETNTVPGIDAAFYMGEKNKGYFFKNKQYLRLSYLRVEGDPIELPGCWSDLPGSWNSGIDAAMYFQPNGKVYLFKGEEYVQITDTTVDKSYPKKLAEGWKDLPSDWNSGIDAAEYFNGHVYFFKGDEYVRFTDSKMDQGCPKKIKGNWPE